MVRTYKTCNLTMKFSKYGFNNKLLDDVILFWITLDVTWTYILLKKISNFLNNVNVSFHILY